MHHEPKAFTKETDLFKPIKLADNDRLWIRLDDDMFRIRIFALDNQIPSYTAQGNWIQRIPERKRGMAGNTWDVAATDYAVEVIHALWGRDRLVFADDETEMTFNHILLSAKQYNVNAETYARFKNEPAATEPDSDYPWEEYRRPLIDEDYEYHEEHELSTYQKVAHHNASRSEGYGLFMEQGTGKTPVVIARVNNEAANMEEDRMYRGIILCPKNVRMNWKNEFEKFSTVEGKVTVLRGSKIQRIEQLVDAMTNENGYKYSVIVSSYKTFIQTWEALQMFEWDLGVLDESHYIKWPLTERFKYAIKLRDRCKARMVLTGTPVTNTPLDLYAQFEFMGKGFSGFQSWKAFRSFYGVHKPGENGFDKIVGVQNLPFMRERLARYSFIIHKRDALPSLPPKVYDVHECSMTKRQAEIYEQLRSQLAAEVEAQLDGGSQNRTILIQNILTKLLRLAQITSGFVTYDEIVDDETGDVIEPKAIEAIEPNPKVEELVNLIKDKSPDEKTIVWACWRHDIFAIERALKNAGVDCVTYFGSTSDKDREEAERRFNCDTECKVMIGNPAAGGTGLNLLGFDPANPDDYTSNADHVIYFSQNWSMVHRSQSEDRAHRRGTRVPVRITDLCVPGTIDEEIRARVTAKRTMALELSDIREILNNVLEVI